MQSLLAVVPGRLRCRRRDTVNNGESKVSCLRCNCELDPIRQAGVGLTVFARTVGIKPRQTAPARQVRFCAPCSVSLALAPPPEGAMNLVVYSAIRDLVGADPALNAAAWDGLHRLLDVRSVEVLSA